MARAYATMRMPAHHARAIQMSVLMGCCAYRSRIVLTMGVTGWFSAKARTGPGMVAVATNAELMNGREVSGEENALGASTVVADRAAMTARQGSGKGNRGKVPADARPGGTAAPGGKPMRRAR